MREPFLNWFRFLPFSQVYHNMHAKLHSHWEGISCHLKEMPSPEDGDASVAAALRRLSDPATGDDLQRFGKAAWHNKISSARAARHQSSC